MGHRQIPDAKGTNARGSDANGGNNINPFLTTVYKTDSSTHSLLGMGKARKKIMNMYSHQLLLIQIGI